MPVSIGIVDDSPSIHEVLRECFESKTNWQICGEAENGEAAVELVQEVNPDLLVLDLSMPPAPPTPTRRPAPLPETIAQSRQDKVRRRQLLPLRDCPFCDM